MRTTIHFEGLPVSGKHPILSGFAGY